MRQTEIRKTSVYLLPGSYTDRSASVHVPYQNKMINTINGIFFPTVIINGKVAGTWKREVKKRQNQD